MLNVELYIICIISCTVFEGIVQQYKTYIGFFKLYLVAKRVAITILHFCNCNFNLHVDWLIDNIVFYAESAIFRPYNGGDY